MSRLIDADKYQKDLLSAYDDVSMEFEVLDRQPTVNAIPIPEGATNGDVIKAMFPNILINETNRGFVLLKSENDNVSIWNSWWNAPYKRGVEE